MEIKTVPMPEIPEGGWADRIMKNIVGFDKWVANKRLIHDLKMARIREALNKQRK
jgi:hypothetical protein